MEEKHIGSNFDDLLKEEEIFEEVVQNVTNNSIIIRNDCKNEVKISYKNEIITLYPDKVIQISNKNFHDLKLDLAKVKIRNGVIKIKDVL